MRLARTIALATWLITWPVAAYTAGAVIAFVAFFTAPIVTTVAVVIGAVAWVAGAVAVDVERGWTGWPAGTSE